MNNNVKKLKMLKPAGPKRSVFQKLIEEGILPLHPYGIDGYLKKMVLKLVGEKTPQIEKKGIVFYLLEYNPEEIKGWVESGGQYGWACIPALKTIIKKSKRWKKEILGWSIPTTLKQELFGSIKDREELELMDKVGVKIHKTIRKQGYITKKQIIEIYKKVGKARIKKDYQKLKDELIERGYVTRSQIVEPKTNKNKRKMFFEKIEALKRAKVRNITMTELKIIMAEVGYSKSTIDARKKEFFEKANGILSSADAQ